nr:LRR receptor-like serine/threonine-protein kinase GSO2 [Ipomoea trifida]
MGTTCVHQIGYFFIILFTFVLMDLCNCSGSNNMGVCKEREMQALLCFKKEFEDPMNRLSSWVDGTNCCTKWEGVVCHNVTGHVVQLRLTNPNFYFEFDHLPKGTLSPCLLELKQLHHLDLSGLYEYFSGSRIPNFIGSFANLQYLDLSNLGFHGMIPHQLGNLTSCDLPKLSQSLRLLNNSLLEVLDLSYNEFNTVVPKWIFNLNNLVSLDLTHSDFLSPLPDGPWNLTSIITLNISDNEMNGSLPSQLFRLSGLVSLNIRDNQFQGPLPNGPWNLTSLSVLDISENNLNGSLPNQLFGLSHLVSLDISFNQLQDPLPNGFSNLTFLKNLDASGNRMNCRIPNRIYDWTNLESLDLSDNQLQGTISNSISNLTSLSALYLSWNMLTGEIPKQIGNLSKLQELSLYGNMLTGEIPKQIGNLSKLQELSLYGNMLTGEIPKQIGNLSKLQVLNLARNRLCGPLPENLGYSFPMIESLHISDNKLEGIVTENHFVNLTKLTTLSASGNRLTMRVNPNWTPPFQLDVLYLSGWNLGPQFPLWLQSQHQISEVDISNAGIEDVHNNKLSGHIPPSLQNCTSLFKIDMGDNGFTGKIPRCGSNNMGVCKEREMQALLCFKNELEDPMNRLSSWVDGADCCSKWEGVVCHNVTGHVVQLRLTNPNYGFEFDHLPKGTLSPCLLELKQLHHLDLSGLYEYFSGSRIPNFIGSFANLQYLDLSYLGFQGIIPPQLGNLTSLHTLILNFEYTSSIIKTDSLDWLSNLSNLQLLDLSYVNLNMAHNWLEAINMLPSLRELHLSGCDLPKLSQSLRLLNNSLLEVLDLSSNEFNTVVPKWIFNLNNLVSLDLTSSGFLSPLPDGPWNLTSIITLNISLNVGMDGSLPSQLFRLSGLVSLNLRDNQFQGPLPNGPWNLTSLSVLDISENNLNGSLPNQLFGLSHLVSLDISSNQLQCPLPNGFSNLTFLKNLDASGNSMNCRIPNRIYDWTNLESLDLSDNQLQGTISNSISNLTSLSALYLDGNMITGEVPNQIGNLSKLQEIYLNGNMLTGEIPKQFGILSKLQRLDLATNRLCGPLPENLGYSFPMIEWLYISDNKLEGIVTENHFVNLTKLTTLDASGNRLTMRVNPNWTPPFQLDELYLSGWNLGPQFPLWLQSQHQISGVDISNAGIEENISNFLCHAQKMPYKLRILHLGGNDLFGEIPDCWMHWSYLQVLNMKENKLTGSIPNSIRLLSHLFSLDMHKNMLSGPIPSLQNCSFLLKVDLAENGFTGKIPRWLGTSLSYLTILRLRSNNLNGELSPEFCHLTSLRILDISNNNLIGVIPKCLKNLTAMINDEVESSVRVFERGYSSSLSGSFGERTIPSSFSDLSSLAVLDLSYNNLSGKIPSGTQLQGFNASCYIGNNLCGPPVSKSCSSIDDGKIPKNENKRDDGCEVDWFYVSMVIGFAVGFGCIYGSLLLVKSWRIAYFQFLDRKLKSFLVWAHALSA